MQASGIFIEPCQTCGLGRAFKIKQFINRDANEMFLKITGQTTVESFKKFMQDHPAYQIEDRGITNLTALHYAARCRNVKLLKYLLSQGALANNTHCNGYSALLAACDHVFSVEQLKCITVLLDGGAHINLAGSMYSSLLKKADRFPRHTTPLYAAAANANSVAVKLLLLKGGVLYHKEAICAKGNENLQSAVKQTINKVKNEIINSTLVLMASSDSNSLFGMLPREINALIVAKGVAIDIN